MPRKKSTPRKKTTAEKTSTNDLLRQEIYYFKGLTVLLLVMLVVVFFTFSALFSAMFAETRMAYENLYDAYKKIAIQLGADYEYIEPATSLDDIGFEFDGEDAVAQEIDTNDWISFAKYGVTAWAPSDWTYFDKPYVKELHYFADGVVRPDNSNDVGDMYIRILDPTADAEVTGEADYVCTDDQIELGPTREGVKYQVFGSDSAEEILVVRHPDFVAEIHFRYIQNGDNVISQEEMQKMKDLLCLSE